MELESELEVGVVIGCEAAKDEAFGVRGFGGGGHGFTLSDRPGSSGWFAAAEARCA